MVLNVKLDNFIPILENYDYWGWIAHYFGSLNLRDEKRKISFSLNLTKGALP